MNFLSDDHARMINNKARELLRLYYMTHGLEELHAVSEMLVTLQDHGVSPKELPIMDEMRDAVLRR